MTFTDPRIPVRFGTLSEAAPGVALLIEGDAPAPAGAALIRFTMRPALGHPAGCACCLPRGPVAEALSRLYLDQARGNAVPLTIVVAVTRTTAGERAVRAALTRDPVSVARFRLVGPPTR